MSTEPLYEAGDYVTTSGTRPGACHRIEDLAYSSPDYLGRWWYKVAIVAGATVAICEDDLRPAEVIGELGRIARG